MHIRPVLAVLSLAALAAAQVPCWEASYGTDLGAGDDTYSSAQPLGFSFAYGSATYTDVVVCSNGYLWLGTAAPAGITPDFSPSEAELLTQAGARICALWRDWNPSATGSGHVYFNSFPAAGSTPARAVITWDNVYEFGYTLPCSFQITLLDTGGIITHYEPNCSNMAATATKLVGASVGNGAVSHPVNFAALPVLSIGNPTLHQTFTSGFPIAATDFEWLADGTGGFIVQARSACGPASFSTYGVGCPQPPVVYEFFSGACDLSAQSFLFLPNGAGGWVVTPGSNQWYSGFTSQVPAGDDTVNTVAMPFSFTHPGGTTSSLDICSNGRIWLVPNLTGTSYSPATSTFCSDPASIAPLWSDLNATGLTGGNGLFADADPSGQTFYVTWNNVPCFGNTAVSCTMQVALFSNGSFELRYQSVTLGATTSTNGLAGYSSGGSPIDPGSRDLTASVPFTTGAGGTPLALGTVSPSRPIIGTSFPLVIDNIPNGTVVGFLLLGFGQIANGFDLSVVGMPGCAAYVPLNTPASAIVVTPPSATMNLSIPNSVAIVGLEVFAQAATLSSGFNALGILSSNGAKMHIGR